MSEDIAEVSRKVRRASQLLLIQRHRTPGVKGWELRKILGKNYGKIIELLNDELNPLGLKVKTVLEEGDLDSKPTPEELERARYFIVFKDPPTPSDVATGGWRIDDLSVLAASLAYIISRRGKAPRKEVEKLLREKFPKWKVVFNLDRYVRRGYLLEDKEALLYIGWRTRAEIDSKTLLNLILSSPSDTGDGKKDEVMKGNIFSSEPSSQLPEF